MSSTTAQTDATATDATATATKSAPTKRAPARKSTTTTATKTTARKSAPVKSTKTTATKSVKVTGPSDRAIKSMVTADLIKVTVDRFMSYPTKTANKVRMVQVGSTWIPRATALDACKQLLAYGPPALWDPRLGPRDVGRPVSSTKAA